MIGAVAPRPRLQPAAACLDFRRSPLLAFYEVTQACDLACLHCRACAQAQRSPAELSPSAALSLIDQLTEFPAPPLLVLTGGDPLKRPDLEQLVAHAVGVGLETSLTPSATPLATPAAIRRLCAVGISRLAVSIDGADARTHDAVRGVSGSFDRSLEILRAAREAGASTQVNTTLTPGNVAQIERLAELLTDHAVALWSVFFLVPVGRAAGLPRLRGAQCEAAFERLWQEAQRRPFAIKTTEAPHYRRYVLEHQLPAPSPEATPSRRHAATGVNDGKGVMFISHTGQIQPSGFLPLVGGTFPQQHVVQVYQESPVFRALRDVGRLEGKCHDCEFRQVCGGSRARAYALTGNPFAQEPDCVYRPGTSTLAGVFA